jgi:hypothetical protein
VLGDCSLGDKRFGYGRGLSSILHVGRPWGLMARRIVRPFDFVRKR